MTARHPSNKQGTDQTTSIPDFLSDDDYNLPLADEAPADFLFNPPATPQGNYKSNPQTFQIEANQPKHSLQDQSRTKSNQLIDNSLPSNRGVIPKKNRLQLEDCPPIEPKPTERKESMKLVPCEPAPKPPAHFFRRFKHDELVPKMQIKKPEGAFESIYSRLFQIRTKDSGEEPKRPKKGEKTDGKALGQGQGSIIGLSSGPGLGLGSLGARKIGLPSQRCIAKKPADHGTPKKDAAAITCNYNVYGGKPVGSTPDHNKPHGPGNEAKWKTSCPNPLDQLLLNRKTKTATRPDPDDPKLSQRTHSRESRTLGLNYAPSTNVYDLAVGFSTKQRARKERIKQLLAKPASSNKPIPGTHKRSRSSLNHLQLHIQHELNSIMVRHQPNGSQASFHNRSQDRFFNNVHARLNRAMHDVNSYWRRPMMHSMIQNPYSDLDKAKPVARSRRMLEGLRMGTKRHNSVEKLDSANLSAYRPMTRRMLFGHRTRRGYNPFDLHKKNQDSYFCKPNFYDRESMHLFGVCDGHGKNGEKVSAFVADRFPLNLLDAFKDEEPLGMTDDDAHFGSMIEELMFRALKTTVQQLEESDIECRFSGCTFNAVFMMQDMVCSCNVGDSRAIMGYMSSMSVAHQLSYDHTPYNLAEKQRIEKSGGVVSQMMDETGQACGPLRVWKPGENLPGLAMTRAVGDDYSKAVGVSWKPDIIIRNLKLNQQVVVFLSTDGVFEVVSNDEVLRVISGFVERKNVEGACDAVMSRVLEGWEANNYDVIDDITFVVIFF